MPELCIIEGAIGRGVRGSFRSLTVAVVARRGEDEYGCMPRVPSGTTI